MLNLALAFIYQVKKTIKQTHKKEENTPQNKQTTKINLNKSFRSF